MKIVSLVISAIFTATISGVCASAAPCDLNQVVEVSIKNMRFDPAHITVCAGQLVRWTNDEESASMIHTVTAVARMSRVAGNVVLPAGAEEFDSGMLRAGQTFEQTLTVAGEYKYICRPHETMGHVGSITVVPAQ